MAAEMRKEYLEHLPMLFENWDNSTHASKEIADREALLESRAPLGRSLKEIAEQFSTFYDLYGGVMMFQQFTAKICNDAILAISTIPDSTRTAASFAKKDSATATRLREAGNVAFRLENYEQALEHYTNAIRFAPKDENETSPNYKGSSLALAHGNRSAVFYKLGHYEATLVDIELALAAGHRDAEGKLNNRKQKAMQDREAVKKEFALSRLVNDRVRAEYDEVNPNFENELEEENYRLLREKLLAAPSQPEAPIESSLSQIIADIKTSHRFVPSATVPSLSAKLQVVVNPADDTDLHVVAQEPIPLGTILSIEQPYCCILQDKSELKYCHHCCRRLKNICNDEVAKKSEVKPMYTVPAVACHSCTNVLFCSNTCKDKAWTVYHQFECALLPLIQKLDPTMVTVLSLAFRMLLTSGEKFSFARKVAEQQMASDASSKDVPTSKPPPKHLLEPSYSTVLRMKHKPKIKIHTCLLTAGLLVELAERSGWLSLKKDTKETLDDRLLASTLLCRHFMQTIYNFRIVYSFISATIMKDKKKDKKTEEKDEEVTKKDCNRFEKEFRSFDEEVVATGIYPVTSSTFRHSCAPNAVTTYHYGSLMLIRASREIAAGEEVTTCFNDHVHYSLMDVGQRQERLKKFIDRCACTACQYELANGLQEKYLPLACERCPSRGLLARKSFTNSSNNNNAQKFHCTVCQFEVSEEIVRQKYVLYERIFRKLDSDKESLLSLNCENETPMEYNFESTPNHPQLKAFLEQVEKLQAMLVSPFKSKTAVSRLVAACKAQLDLTGLYKALADKFEIVGEVGPAQHCDELYVKRSEIAFNAKEVSPTVEGNYNLIFSLNVFARSFALHREVVTILGKKKCAQMLQRGSSLEALKEWAISQKIVEDCEEKEKKKAQEFFNKWKTRLDCHQTLLSIFSINELTVQNRPSTENALTDSFKRLPADEGSGFLAYAHAYVLWLKTIRFQVKENLSS